MKKTAPTRDRIYVRAGQFTLRYAGSRRAPYDIAAGPEFAIVVVTGGALHWTLEDGRQGELGTNAALLLAPGETFGAAGTGAAEYVALNVSPAAVLDCSVRARLTRDDAVISFRSPFGGDERLSRIARDMAEELRGDAGGRELILDALVEQALVHVLRTHANIQRSAGLELSRAGLVDRRIRRAVELMHVHLERELPLEELAGAAHLSPFHFARLFKKLTGAAPHAYLASLRVARARALLAETDLSVTEVAARVGYASSSHFSKAFRQATGLSPRAFRNALVRT